jgi:DNA mismatch repair protein MutS
VPPRAVALEEARVFEATERECHLAQRITAELRGTVDVERICSRIALASARPRDLSGLRATLDRIPALAAVAASFAAPALKEAAQSLGIDERWTRLLHATIATEPGTAIT